MNELLWFPFLLLQEKPAGEVAENIEKVTEEFGNSWTEMWDRVLGWKEKLILHLPEIVVALIAVLIAYFIALFVKRFSEKPLSRMVKRTSVRHLISNALYIAIIIIGLILALGVLNLDNVLTAILAAGGVAGLAIGLALQGTLSNTFSGISLSVNDVLNVGDWVETNGYRGNVEQINLRHTRLREADNNIVVIPNKTILENPFKNFGLTPRIRVILKCGVHYKTDLEAARELVLKAIEKRFVQLEYEKVEFFYNEFGDSSINFTVRFWIDATANVTILDAQSQAIMIIKKVFEENNIDIPFPIRTLEFKRETEEEFFHNKSNEPHSS